MRPSNRRFDEMRKVTLTPNYSNHAEGSCLVECGGTKILCTASIENRVPPFLRHSGTGWVTAEYGMLPRATHTRGNREASTGKQSGRTQEIQRLIGRSLRAVVDMKLLGERQILIDCDVLEADGGTRTASITGGYVALVRAIQKLQDTGELKTDPIIEQCAAISCGIYNGQPVLDLDYDEDSACEMDANFVMSAEGKIIEIQCTAEESPVDEGQFMQLMQLGRKGVQELAEMQKAVLNG